MPVANGLATSGLVAGAVSLRPVGWRAAKPGYELFERLVARPLGQPAIPSNIEEAQRGMVSTIDTIAFDGDEQIDIRS